MRRFEVVQFEGSRNPAEGLQTRFMVRDRDSLPGRWLQGSLSTCTLAWGTRGTIEIYRGSMTDPKQALDEATAVGQPPRGHPDCHPACRSPRHCRYCPDGAGRSGRFSADVLHSRDNRQPRCPQNLPLHSFSPRRIDSATPLSRTHYHAVPHCHNSRLR